MLLRRPKRTPRTNPDDQDGLFSGFLDCAVCGSRLWTGTSTKRQAGAYKCGNAQGRGASCTNGQTAVTKADPVIDQVLAQRLGSLEVIEVVIERALEEEAAAVQGQRPAETERRLVELDTQRRRVSDAYVAGVFDLKELQKRMATLEGEKNALQALQTRESDELEIDQALVVALVDVFGSWRDLGRREKREVLRDFQIRIALRKPTGKERGRVEVEGVRIGVIGLTL